MVEDLSPTRAMFFHSSLPRDLPSRFGRLAGRAPREIDLGAGGCVALWSDGLDVDLSSDRLVLLFGQARCTAGSAVSARRLREEDLITPHTVAAEKLRGNAWTVAFSRREPRFLIYQTLMALPQLFYTCCDEGILCATDLRLLLELAPRCEVDSEILPMHFLYRLVPGEKTYFRDVKRLFPGHALVWGGAEPRLRQVRDLRPDPGTPRFDRVDGGALAWLDEQMSTVLGSLCRGLSGQAAQDTEAGDTIRFANLLSGGEDSSILQLLINDQLGPGERPSSYSFAVTARSFELEIEYAKSASRALNTEHVFFPIKPEEFPHILIRAIDTLAQPTFFNEGVPCQLALAESLRADAGDGLVFVAGQAADSLHGVGDLTALIWYEKYRRLPAASSSLLALAWLMRACRKSAAAVILDDAADLVRGRLRSGVALAPLDHVALTVEVDTVSRCFGEAAVAQASEARRELAAGYRDSTSLREEAQLIDFLTAGYEPAVVAAQLFASQGLELIQPYLDEDIVRAIMAFDASCRFVISHGLTSGQLKPLQKRLLARRRQERLAGKKKGGTAFNQDLWSWMRRGVLKDLIEAMERPDFVPRALFAEIKNKPGDFLWNLLIYDLFQQRIVRHRRSYRPLLN